MAERKSAVVPETLCNYILKLYNYVTITGDGGAQVGGRARDPAGPALPRHRRAPGPTILP